MKIPAANSRNRFSGIITLVILCLAFLMQAAIPAPARADDPCGDRAWINLPEFDIMAQLTSDATFEEPVVLAMSKDYAIIGWYKQDVYGTIQFMVAPIITTETGKTVGFNYKIDKVYTPPKPSGAGRPSVAINDQGHVIIAAENPPQMISWQACKVVPDHIPSLKCGKYNYSVHYGEAPSVALRPSGANGHTEAVLVYEGDVFQEMWYRTGTFDAANLAVNWTGSHHYDYGTNPYIAMNDADAIVEVHHGSTNFFHPNKIFYKVGTISGGNISWGKSYEYDSDGYMPTVALVGQTVIEFHDTPNDHGIYYRYGTMDSYAKWINWQGNDDRHRIGGDLSGPALAVNSQGDMLMGYRNWKSDPQSIIRGGLGALGFGYVCPWPVVLTLPMSHVGLTDAVTGGFVANRGDSPVQTRGVCWSTSPVPTTSDKCTRQYGALGIFTSHITGLSVNTGYYVRAYATNYKGPGYGEERYFHTSQGTPKVQTSLQPWFVTAEGALVTGHVTSQGGAPVTERGVCWSTSAGPTIDGQHMDAGSGLGGFDDFIMGLKGETLYHVRAYATNKYGTVYGADLSFTTLHPSLPTVYSADPLDITAGSALLGGEVTRQGWEAVTERGVVWSTQPMPNLNNHKAVMGDGQGAFSQNVTGFTFDTTYYVRAYAINNFGQAYGQEKLFTASDDVTPRVTTTAPYGETYDSALSGGYVTNSGQTPVTARGVCWSASPSPTVNDSSTTDGQGLGQFYSAMTGLASETGYYVRAYATNHAGTSYGEEYFFHSTDPSYPTVHTLAVSELTAGSALVVGQVILEGTAAVTARGICWSTQPNPRLSDNVLAAGSGVGTFQATIGGLEPETVYYARAFATNQFGTSYGHIVNFRTTFCPHPCR